MDRLRKGIALFLAVVMCIPMIPASAATKKLREAGFDALLVQA